MYGNQIKTRVTNLHEYGREHAVPGAPTRHLQETQHNVPLVRSQNEVVRLEQQDIRDPEPPTPVDEVRYVVAALERARPHVRLVRDLADVDDDVTQGRVLVHESVHVVGVLAHERSGVELFEEVVDCDGECVQGVEPLRKVLLHHVQVLVRSPVGAHRLALEREDDGIALDVDHVVDRHCGYCSDVTLSWFHRMHY